MNQNSELYSAAVKTCAAAPCARHIAQVASVRRSEEERKRGDGLASRHNCRRSIEVVRNGVRARSAEATASIFSTFQIQRGNLGSVLRRIIAWQSHNLPERGDKGTGE